MADTQDREAVERAARAWDEHDAVWLGDWPNGRTCPVCGPFDGESIEAHRMRFALDAAGAPALRAEVEHWKARWRGAQAEVERLATRLADCTDEKVRGRVEMGALRAERDRLRDEVDRLRAGIYDAAARAEAETRFRADVSRPDTVERDRQVFQEGVWWARAVLRALAGSGEQPGEITVPTPIQDRIDACRPAPVVPDSAGLDSAVRAAEAALSRATHGDDPTTWAGTPWWHVHQLLRVLATVGQGVSAGQARAEAERRYWARPSSASSLPGFVGPFVEGAQWASRTTRPSGQEPTTRGAGA